MNLAWIGAAVLTGMGLFCIALGIVKGLKLRKERKAERASGTRKLLQEIAQMKQDIDHLKRFRLSSVFMAEMPLMVFTIPGKSEGLLADAKKEFRRFCEEHGIKVEEWDDFTEEIKAQEHREHTEAEKARQHKEHQEATAAREHREATEHAEAQAAQGK